MTRTEPQLHPIGAFARVHSRAPPAVAIDTRGPPRTPAAHDLTAALPRASTAAAVCVDTSPAAGSDARAWPVAGRVPSASRLRNSHAHRSFCAIGRGNATRARTRGPPGKHARTFINNFLRRIAGAEPNFTPAIRMLLYRVINI